MFLVLIIAVPLLLLLTWAVIFDSKQRRRSQPLTDHDARGIAKKTRIQSEGKGAEWGGGL